jgi:hypothetical protein
MIIPFQQARAWLDCSNAYEFRSNNLNWTTGNTFKHVRGKTNGSIVLAIQTLLTAPVDPATISVQVFVRGAENMDFASPTTQSFYSLTTATIQDGDAEEKAGTQIVSHKTVSGTISRPIDHMYLTYMGERIASMRVLLRRQCLTWSWCPVTIAPNDMAIRSLTMSRVPQAFGYNPTGLDTVKGIVTPANTYNFNWTQPNFLSYLAPAFRGNRGSVNWTCVFDVGSSGNVLKWAQVTRKKVAAAPAITNDGSAFGTQGAQDKYFNNGLYPTTSGAAIATGQTANAINWQMPFYSQHKFTFNDFASVGNNNTNEFVTKDFWTFQSTHGGSYGVSPIGNRFHFYSGAGTDFDLLYFLHVPTYQVMTSSPVAV